MKNILQEIENAKGLASLKAAIVKAFETLLGDIEVTDAGIEALDSFDNRGS